MALLDHLERLGRLSLNKRGFRSRFVESPYGRLHIFDAHGRGRLPPFIVLHGVGSSATAYGRLLVRLRAHSSRVIAPDAPGHGQSGATGGRASPHELFEAVAVALDEVLDEPAVIFGSSLGGAMAIRYALSRPNRVERLVLCSPAGARMSQEGIEALRAVFRMRGADAGTDFVDRLYHRPPWYRSWLGRELKRLMLREHIQDFLGSVTPDDQFAPGELQALAMPILLIWGQSEKLLPTENLDYFRAHLPSRAQIVEPEGFGHCPHIERPAELCRLLVDFAQGNAR